MVSTGFRPLDKMKRQVESSRTEGDGALYNKLLKTAEVATKFIVSGLVSCLEDHKDRYRYRHKYNLVRADGIGTWGDVATKILTGPSARALHEGVYNESQQLNQRKSDSSTWQYQAVKTLHSALEVMYPPCGDMPQSVKALLWFQYLAHLRNKSNPHASPTSQQYTNAAVYLEESLNILIKNLNIFYRPWAKLIRNQSGKWNVTRVGGDRDEFSELWSENNISLRANSGIYLKLDEEYRYVDLVKTDKSAEEYYLPNENFNDNNYELLSYHSNSRRFGDSSEYHTPPDTLPESETEGHSHLKVVGNTFTNLPHPVSGYVERDELEEEVTDKIIKQERYPIVTLRGRGGIGKTSLALTVLHKISKRPVYDAIFWFSSRDIDLQSSGPKPVSPDIISKYDIAKKIS